MEKGNSSVSFEVQRSIISNHIDDFLNGLKQLRNEEEQNASKLDDIEKLSMELRFLRTFVLFGNSSLDDFYSKMSLKFDDILAKYDMNHLVPRLLENIKSYLSLKNDYVASAITMTEEQLFEYLDCLLKNLHDLPKYWVKYLPPWMSKYNILLEVCGYLGDFNGLKIKG